MQSRLSWKRLVILSLLALGGCDRAATGDDAISELPATSAVAAADSIPDGVTAEEVQEGRELFLPCAVCHGLDGAGNQLGPPLRFGQWIHVDGSLNEIEEVIRLGVPSPRDFPVPMVAMGGGNFDAGELRAVAAYVYAISRGRRPAPPPG